MDSTLVMNFMLSNDGQSVVAVKEANEESSELLRIPIVTQNNLYDPHELLENLKNNLLNQSFLLQQCNSSDGIINLGTDNIELTSEQSVTHINITTKEQNEQYSNVEAIQTNTNIILSPEKEHDTESNTSDKSDKVIKNTLPKKSERKKNGKPKKKIPLVDAEQACFKCDVCSQEFKTHHLLQKHMHDHSQEKSYQCPKCTASFNVPVNFTLHLAIHNIGEPKCPKCGRKFARLASLKAHMTVHQVDENLYCTDCTDSFETKAQLDAHLKLHNEKWSNSETKRCKLCRKQFTQPLLYRRHLRDHYRMQIKSIKQTKKGGVRYKNFYKCRLCLKMFKKPSQLTRHIRVHTGEKPFKCTLCNRSFTQKSSVRIHMWQHSGIRPYNCSLCPAKFSQKGNLDSHVRRVHTIQECSPMYRCSRCPCFFKKLGSLNIHHKRVHGVKKITKSDENLNKSEGEIGTTVLKTTPENNDSSQQSANQSDKKKKKIDLNNFEDSLVVSSDNDHSATVTMLDKTTGQKGGKYIKIKQRLVNNVRFYECSYCVKRFKKPSDLMRHLRIHTREKPFQCEICDKTFTLKSTLQMHLKTHNKFPCSECNLFFSSEKSLQSHNKVHHLKNFECAICKESFPNFESIKSHSVIHNPPSKKQRKEVPPEVQKIELSEPLVLTELQNGLLHAQPKHRNDLTNGKGRPHKCTVCTAAFMKVSHLKQHLRRHTGERPFTCSICNRKFTTKSSVKAHHRTHDFLKPYSCPTCGMNFSTLSSMRRHHTTHSSKRPYMCPYCHKTFKAAVNCRKHMKIHKTEIAEQQKKKREQIKTFESVLDSVKNAENEINATEVTNCDNYLSSLTDKFSANEANTIILPEYMFNEPIASEILEQTNQSLEQQLLNASINFSLNCDSKQVLENSVSIIENQDHPILNIVYNDSLTLQSPVISSPEANVISQLNSFDFNQIKLLNMSDADILSVDLTGMNNILGNNDDKIVKSSDKKQLRNCQENSLNDDRLNNEFSDSKRKCINSKDKQNSAEGDINYSQETHKCYECNEELPTSLKLREHIKDHVKQELILRKSLGLNEIIIDDFEKKDKNTVVKEKECMYCSKIFRKPSDLVRHIRTHTGERPFACKFCDKRFAVKCTLDSHTKIHTGEKPYTCHICGFSLATKSGLRNHMLIHNGAKPFKCQMCDLKFRTVRQRKVHILSHLEKPTSPEAETAALENSNLSKNDQELSNSLTEIVPSQMTSFEKQTDLNNKQDMTFGQTIIESCITDDQTDSKILLNSNNEVSSNEPSFLTLDENNPIVSNLEFNYLLDNGLITLQTIDSDLSANQLPSSTTKSHNDLIEDCGTSQIIYSDSGNGIPLTADNNIDFENCILLQLSEVDSTVPIINEKKKSKVSKSKPSKIRRECNECGKSFFKPCQLERHKRTHTGERPFACDLCEKAFSQKSSLQLHRKRHTGDRPYPCEHCGHSFTQKGNLQTHLRRVHKQASPTSKKTVNSPDEKNQIVLQTVIDEGMVFNTNDLSVVEIIN